MKKKTFDAVAFMRERREELSRAYAALSAEQIHERIQQSLKNDPLWKKHRPGKGTGEETRHFSGNATARSRLGLYAPCVRR